VAAIGSGAALEKFRAMVEAQGGDPRVCDDPGTVLQQPRLRVPYVASRDGVVQRVEPRAIGMGITAMGGGRSAMEDTVDPSVGFLITARPGDRVRRGASLATIHARDASGEAVGRAALDGAITIGDGPITPRPLISHRVTVAGVETVA
jgi:pyrimidine-nucleoside phosphorylase